MNTNILITGPSGMGKTTLAKWVAEHYHIPFINHSIMDFIPVEENIKTHKEWIQLSKTKPDLALQCQLNLLMGRANSFYDHLAKGFVTDRGHIDSLVYTSTQCSPSTNPEYNILNWMFKMSSRIHDLFTHVIFIPWIDGWELEDNNVRIIDPNYQKTISQKYETVLDLFSKHKVLTLETSDFSKRQQIVEDFINKD